jgi:hypothetical protein
MPEIDSARGPTLRSGVQTVNGPPDCSDDNP